MEKTKISIIIPVYNVEKYVERCLESVCGLKIKNEIIVVNDGSTDNSLEVVERFREKHKEENIKIITQENRGLSGARNTGIRNAVGEYISFLDSDDFVDTEKYEEIIIKTIENNLDVGLGNGRYYYETRNENNETFIRDENLEKLEINTGYEWFKKLRELKSYRSEVWDKIYRTALLKQEGIMFREGKLHEDEEFTVRIFLKAKRIKYFDLCFYNYFQENETSIMRNKSLKNHYDMMENADYILAETKNVDDEKVVQIIKGLVQDYYGGIDRQVRHLPETEEIAKFKEDMKKRYAKITKEYQMNPYQGNVFRRLDRSFRKYRDKIKKYWKEKL